MLGTMPGRELSAGAQLDEEWRHFQKSLFHIRERLTKTYLSL